MSLFVDTPDDATRAGGSPDQPRRRSDRDTTPGRCGNLDYCSIGMQRVIVQVPINDPFVCPECGGRLRSPGRVAGSRRPWVLPALRLVVLAAAIAASLAVGFAIGRVQPAVHAAVHEASAVIGLEPAPPPPATAAPAPARPPPDEDAAARLDPLANPAPVFVVGRPYPAHDLPPDAGHPPVRLVHEAHFGQVIIDCTMDPVLTHPACRLTQVKGADAFSAAALAWLQNLAVQYAPSDHHGAAVLLAHRWRVVFEDDAGSQK